MKILAATKYGIWHVAKAKRDIGTSIKKDQVVYFRVRKIDNPEFLSTGPVLYDLAETEDGPVLKDISKKDMMGAVVAERDDNLNPLEAPEEIQTKLDAIAEGRKPPVVEEDTYVPLPENTVDPETGEITIKGVPKLPHISPDITLFPHQAVALKLLDNPKNLGVVDADPGAGKTLIGIMDIVNNLQKGIIKRPLWGMPGPLIEQQKEAIGMFTDNSINVVALTTDTKRRYGVDHLLELVKTAPPNTIFLTSYSYMQNTDVNYKWDPEDPTMVPPPSVDADGWWNDSLEEQEGDLAFEEHARYSYVWQGYNSVRVSDLPQDELDKYKEKWLAEEWTPMAEKKPWSEHFYEVYENSQQLLDAGIDYVYWDESHKLCNSESITGAGARVFTDRYEDEDTGLTVPETELQRIATGTIAPNTPQDVWAQLQMVDPTMYPKLKDFVKEFAVLSQTGGIMGWDEDSLKSIRLKMEQKGAVSIRRTQWRNLLPQQEIKAHKVNFKPSLQKMYNDILDSVLEKIFQDPDMVAAWEKFTLSNDPNPKLPESILAKLTVLDIFVTAPESNPITDQLPESLKKSPKIAMIDRLLDQHFANPDNGKVIIFSRWVAAASVIKKYSRHSDKMVFYASGEGEALERFKTDPKVKVMSAAEGSLAEGHNLAMANRIIRANLPWTPGMFVQTLSRAFRPQAGGGKPFETVFVDIILVEGTIDIPKFKRLAAKYQSMNIVQSDYSGVRSLEIPPMNVSTLKYDTAFVSVEPYVDEMVDIEMYERKKGKFWEKAYGNKRYEVANGQQLPGSKMIEVPVLDVEFARERVQKAQQQMELLDGLQDPNEIVKWLQDNDLHLYVDFDTPPKLPKEETTELPEKSPALDPEVKPAKPTEL